MTKQIEKIIKKAINEAVEAGRRQAEQETKNAYKSTERRLYAYPDLKEKVAKDMDYLEDLMQYGLKGHSKDIARFKRSGVRLSDEDLLDALAKDIQASIAANEHEIKTIDDALDPLTNDAYFRTIPGKYFEQLSDDELSKELFCDPSTIRKNRGRLVRRVAVRLYGVNAI